MVVERRELARIRHGRRRRERHRDHEPGRRNDQAADDHDWCTEYEEFSEKVGGLARKAVPRAREYEFRIQAEFTLLENEADDVLDSYFNDMTDAEGDSIQADIVGDVTVTNRFSLRYTASDPEDVLADEILDHHEITACNAVIISYTTLD